MPSSDTAVELNQTQYTTVTGFFLQDEASTDASLFDYVRLFYLCFISEESDANQNSNQLWSD